MTSNVHPLSKPATLLQLRIELDGVMTTVWRVVLVPESITLDRLHRVIQIAMGWEDRHLHEFVIGNVRYGTPDPEWQEPGSLISEKGVSLTKALGRGKRFRYIYDLGDDWEHTLTVEKRGVASDSPSQVRCLSGENACPPEDVGGPPGYEDFLRALADPDHEEHDECLAWCGGAFDRTRCDIELVNRRLADLRIPTMSSR